MDKIKGKIENIEKRLSEADEILQEVKQDILTTGSMISKKPPQTYSEFKNILKKTNADSSVISKWQKTQRKTGRPQLPDKESLKIMYVNGIPLEWWIIFDIEEIISNLKKEEIKRKTKK